MKKLHLIPLSLLLLATRTNATPLLLRNDGFECPLDMEPGTQDSTYNYSVPNWIEHEPSGNKWEWDVYCPGPKDLPLGAHGGHNVLAGIAYTPKESYVEYELTNTLQAGMCYTLSGWVADPDDHPTPNAARFFLYAGTHCLGAVTNQPDQIKSWHEDKLVYKAGYENPLAGQKLSVRIMNGENNSYRVFVDDVTLDAFPMIGAPAKNLGFEKPAELQAGKGDAEAGDSVPDWVEYEPSGHPWEWNIYCPAPSDLPGAHEGRNVLQGIAYTPNESYVDQVLGNTLHSGGHYQLSAWVADPDGHTPENGVRFFLYAGTNLLSETTGVPDAAKKWQQANLDYAAGAKNPLAGQRLHLRIMHCPSNSYRVWVDDVQFKAIAP